MTGAPRKFDEMNPEVKRIMTETKIPIGITAARPSRPPEQFPQ
jgi:hypothetical protein